VWRIFIAYLCDRFIYWQSKPRLILYIFIYVAFLGLFLIFDLYNFIILQPIYDQLKSILINNRIAIVAIATGFITFLHTVHSIVKGLNTPYNGLNRQVLLEMKNHVKNSMYLWTSWVLLIPLIISIWFNWFYLFFIVVMQIILNAYLVCNNYVVAVSDYKLKKRLNKFENGLRELYIKNENATFLNWDDHENALFLHWDDHKYDPTYIYWRYNLFWNYHEITKNHFFKHNRLYKALMENENREYSFAAILFRNYQFMHPSVLLFYICAGMVYYELLISTLPLHNSDNESFKSNINDFVKVTAEIFVSYHRSDLYKISTHIQKINPDIPIPFLEKWGLSIWMDEIKNQFNLSMYNMIIYTDSVSGDLIRMLKSMSFYTNFPKSNIAALIQQYL